jgi:hypothetical protein
VSPPETIVAIKYWPLSLTHKEGENTAVIFNGNGNHKI